MTSTRLGLVSLAAVMTAVLVVAPAYGDVVLFTDEPSFVTAVGLHDLETFEAVAVGPRGTSTTMGNLFFDSSPGSQIAVLNVPGAWGTHNTTPGGERFLHADSLTPAFHDPMNMGRVDGPLRAWGANFTDLDGGIIAFLVDGISEYAFGK